MALTSDQMAVLSRLLDEALPLDQAGRYEWLQSLAAEYQDLSQVLQEALLPEQQMPGPELRTLPKFERADAKAAAAGGLVSGARVGPYELIRPLGAGGMAEVWLARRADGTFKREVALKLPMRLRRDLEPRFVREREILASLNHQNIAKLFDAGFAQDGQPYLALEYVPGMPFTAYCDDHRLSIRERLELLRQVLSAVQYAHANLVLHRDLKPSNILVTAEGQVRLLDFGIAKLLSDGEAKETELTQAGGRALTLDYAAPEQIAGTPITTAADVYALGVMLYELLTSVRPYRPRRDSRGALEEAILLAEPAPPSRVEIGEAAANARATTPKKLTRMLKGDMDVVALKALKKTPSERYATASEFGDDIARFLRGEVVLAQRDTVAYRALKFVRRHRIAIAVAGVLVLTLAGGLAASLYEAHTASAERDAAQQAQLRSLTQTASARLREGDIPGALGIILEVLPHQAAQGYAPEALSVFQESRAADAQIAAFSGHTDVVTHAVFSPSGRTIATASYDQSVRIWDVACGCQILVLRGHTAGVNGAEYSPDGRYVLTAARDKTARIWDASTGQQIRVLSGHTNGLWSAVFSPDARYVVTASGDRTARIWDAASGQQLALLSGHTEPVHAAEFSPDGRRVVTASWDRTARVWDAATGRQTLLLGGHTERLWNAAFSPDGAQIVTASDDKTGRIWDAATGQSMATLIGHTSRVMSAHFSPDGRRVVTSSEDATIRVWDAATGRQLMILSGYTGRLNHAAFSPDGRLIVASSYDKTARLWDAEAGHELRQLSGHTERVFSAAFSPDGRRIVTASWDKTARVWNSATAEQVLLLSGHKNVVVAAVFSSDGARIVTASLDGTARIWNAATGEPIKDLIGHSDQVWGAAFSPDGTRVVTASGDKTARVWDAAGGKELFRLMGHAERVLNAAYSPDGERIVTTSTDKTVRIWSAVDGRQLTQLSGVPDVVESVAFSPDNRSIVTASDDKTARVWDVATGRQTQILTGHSNIVGSAAFSADGRRIVTSSFDKTARIWDAKTARQLAVLRGHSDLVETALFSPDGRLVVTASDDKSARIWDASIPSLETQIRWVSAAQFDLLQSSERFQLGLPALTDVRSASPANSQPDDALARHAEEAERAALSAPDAASKDSHLLEAFGYYAQAAEQARRENWPEDVWRNWRYRRASLARLLAREGLLQEVADRYAVVLKQ